MQNIYEGQIIPLYCDCSAISLTNLQPSSIEILPNQRIYFVSVKETCVAVISYINIKKKRLKEGILQHSEFNDVLFEKNEYETIHIQKIKCIKTIKSIKTLFKDSNLKIYIHFENEFLSKYKNLRFYIENSDFEILWETKKENIWEINLNTECLNLECVIKEENFILRFEVGI